MPSLADLQKFAQSHGITTGDEIKSNQRRQEHLGARWLLHQLMPVDGVIGRNPDGSPAWPQNWIGSISHKNGHVCVAFSNHLHIRGLGVDIESVNRFNVGIAKKICTPEEQDILGLHETTDQTSKQRLLSALFAAKEALYKAMYPNGRIQFWFEDAVVIKWEAESGNISMKLLKKVATHAHIGHIVKGQVSLVSHGTEQYSVALMVDTLP